jgi:magnesium transporter
VLTRYKQKHLTWVDLVAPTPQEVRSLLQEFNLHPTLAQELLSPSYRSKVERKGDELLMVLHFPTLRGVSQRTDHEIDFIIGRNFLITTRYENTDPLHIFARVFEVNAVLGRESANHGGHLFASMTRSLYQALGDECDSISEKLKEIEERIFKGDERQMVAELSQVGRILHDFHVSLIPHYEMLSSLEAPAVRVFGPEFAYYLHEVQGECRRIERTIEHLRDSLREMRETNNSLLSTKQNEVMKQLTVLAFVFLPISFIAALFGMNTVNNPIIGSAYDFWLIAGSMLMVAIGCFIYFRYKDWI